MKEVQNGTVFIWKYNESNNLWSNLLGKAIKFFTGMPYTHVGVWCGGARYDSQNPGPVKHNKPPKKKQTVWYTPKEPLNQEQVNAMKEYLESKLGDKGSYNHLKLVVLALVYPTRWFWNWIGWVPFQHDFYGVICSVYVDEAFKAAGIDLLPNHNEEYTAPGDFTKSKKLVKVH